MKCAKCGASGVPLVRKTVTWQNPVGGNPVGHYSGLLCQVCDQKVNIYYVEAGYWQDQGKKINKRFDNKRFEWDQ